MCTVPIVEGTTKSRRRESSSRSLSLRTSPKKSNSGFSGTAAHAVAGNQQVGDGVGDDAYGNSFYHALLWNGTANSAVDLNPMRFSNLVVLTSRYGTNGVQTPLLLFAASSSTAYTIDANGNVWGTATDSAGMVHAVEWSPVSEPTAVVMTGIGTLVLAALCAKQFGGDALELRNGTYQNKGIDRSHRYCKRKRTPSTTSSDGPPAACRRRMRNRRSTAGVKSAPTSSA